MKRNLVTSAIAILAFTVLLGVVYPLVITGAAQIVPKAKVSLARDTKGDPRYFQPRPSADSYDPHATAFSNRGPNQASAAAYYRRQVAAYRKLNGADPPPDAVETSGSGLDPLISEANADIQARRVARVRQLPLAQVMQLVKDNTDGRTLGLLGEPGVNTTTLNEALDDRS
jgi:K+-transporting ATPase ATPase C chain